MVSDAGTRKNDALWINDDVTDKQAVRRSLFADRCSSFVVSRLSFVVDRCAVPCCCFETRSRSGSNFTFAAIRSPRFACPRSCRVSKSVIRD